MQRTSLLTDPDQLARVLAGKADDSVLENVRFPPNASQIISEKIPLRYGGTVIAVFVVSILGLLVMARIDGIISTLDGEIWRGVLLAPVLLFFLMLVEPALRSLRDRAATSLLVKIPSYESNLSEIVDALPRSTVKGQFVGMSIGLLISGAIFFPGSEDAVNVSSIYAGFNLIFMFSYMSWLVYTWIVGIRMFARLQAIASNYEPLRCEQMYPIGRWAIAVGTSLIFASALSMLFVTGETLITPEIILVYSIMLLTAFGVTFVAAWSTHTMMDLRKKAALGNSIDQIAALSHELENSSTNESANELRAWIALESRLQETSSWPFDTAMLRRMFLAISIPGAAVAARVVPSLLTS